MDDDRPLIPVITGPTGVGKTAVATALAALAPIEIVSADSRQVYRGLDIGTAKPSGADRAAAPYHGLDLIEPAERYSAGRFARDAGTWIVGTGGRGRLPVVVGGTGFYLRALFDGLFDEPALDPARRAKLGDALARLPAAELDRWARRLDAGFGGGGAQRAMRAIEVALLAGAPLSKLHDAAPALVAPVRAWYAVMELPREGLVARIERRARAMVEQGLLDEVRRALDAGIPDDAPGLTGVGYAEAIDTLRGRRAEPDLVPAITVATRRYAKRQVTWFRHQLKGPGMVLEASKPPDVLAQELLSGYRAAVESGNRESGMGNRA